MTHDPKVGDYFRSREYIHSGVRVGTIVKLEEVNEDGQFTVSKDGKELEGSWRMRSVRTWEPAFVFNEVKKLP